MYNSIQDTLIIGKKVIYLPSCHSTNDIAAEIVHAGLFEEGTVVITGFQLKGRGQRGTSWTANPGENLTFSVILEPGYLAVHDQFLISQVTALGLQQYIQSYISDCQVKWPNDILANRKKICGVLIENAIQGTGITSSIIGIGVNINQVAFGNDRATSLTAETGRSFSLLEEFPKLIRVLDAFVARLKEPSQYEKLRSEYLNVLFGHQSKFQFRYKNEIFEGTVRQVTQQGMLVIQTGERLLEVGLKEIEWLWS